MKKLFFSLLILISWVTVNAQERYTDSLISVFSKTTADSNKVRTAILISSKLTSIDSSLAWAEKALLIAKKAKWKQGEAKASDQVAAVFLKVSNYPKALEYLLPALEISEELNDHQESVALLRKIGRVFGKQADYKTALTYYYKAVAISRRSNQDERAVYFPIGSAYDNMNQLDSALFYYQRAYEYSSTVGDKKGLAGVLSHLGVLHLKMNNLALALSYGRMAVSAFETYNRKESGSAYRHLADIYNKLGYKDSARFYAYKTYEHGIRINSADMQLEGAALLASLYDDATAVKYYRIANELRDSIFSEEKSTEIAKLSFNYRQREAEIQREKLKAAEERKQDIQYAAIAIGLLVFVVLYLIFSHTIVAKEKPVRFVGVLSLLMLFEFINLVIHPYVGNLTHHSPLWMLLVMVGIAALLIPLHHKIEKWVVSRMVERNKKIRLSAAKKTIAALEGTMMQEEKAEV